MRQSTQSVFLLLVFFSHVAFADEAKDAAIVETLLRLPNIDVNANEKMKAAVLRHLETQKQSPRYLELVERFKLTGVEDDLIQLAVNEPSSTLGVGAAKLLLGSKDRSKLVAAIDHKELKTATSVVTAIGHVASKDAMELLTPLVADNKRPSEVRVAAARGLGRNRNGEKHLMELVRTGKLSKDLKFTVGDILHASADATIREEVAKFIELPATAAGEPLPTVAKLLEMKGDPLHGQKIFATTGTCANCHIVNKQGKEVGPNLSEIGSKLSRDAMFVSILDPSAGISHNYESYSVITIDGVVVVGLKISETDESITLKNEKAIVITIEKDEIDEMTKQKLSLMPANLQKTMKVHDLVSVVEYLTTLKKKK